MRNAKNDTQTMRTSHKNTHTPQTQRKKQTASSQKRLLKIYKKMTHKRFAKHKQITHN